MGNQRMGQTYKGLKPPADPSLPQLLLPESEDLELTEADARGVRAEPRQLQ